MRRQLIRVVERKGHRWMHGAGLWISSETPRSVSVESLCGGVQGFVYVGFADAADAMDAARRRFFDFDPDNPRNRYWEICPRCVTRYRGLIKSGELAA